MALVTFCPSCNTIFRVNSSQLQAHGGDVRCGHCQRVFNGLATLITVNESAIEYPSPSRPRRIQVFDSSAIAMPPDALAAQPADFDWSPQPGGTPDRLFDDTVPEKSSSWLWGSVNIVLLLLLIGQLTYHYRTELTVALPKIRPSLEHYCNRLGCNVPYPQEIKLLGIESSDLQKNAARQPEITTMQATIHNHAPFPQALPAVHLLLLDAKENTIASKIFTAQDYLLDEKKNEPFLKPRHDLEIRLDFDSSQLNAVGYRLLLLYP